MTSCQECEAEFEIVFSGKEEIRYCPFCGENLEVSDWENEFDADDIEWDE
jgi:rRNA maturation endonuclease Nob1